MTNDERAEISFFLETLASKRGIRVEDVELRGLVEGGRFASDPLDYAELMLDAMIRSFEDVGRVG